MTDAGAGDAARGGDAARAGGPGEGLGLPRSGPGSVASWKQRILGLLVDWILATIIGRAFLADVVGLELAPLLVFLTMHLLLVSTVGTTIGHRLTGIAVRRIDAPVPVGLGRGLARAVLLTLVIPAAVWDADRRGLHDRAAGTIVVRR